MILYLDTSSLIKLYVSAAGSAEVSRLVSEASVVATSVVAYAETRSVLARLRREGALSRQELDRVRADFEHDWPRYLAVDVSEGIWRHAGDLAEAHALRAFDGLHLASFLFLSAADLGEPIRFCAHDGRLTAAAAASERP